MSSDVAKGPGPETLPQVSIIVPCFNEERTINHLLQAIYVQTYPRHLIDVIIADGNSTDSTRSQIHNFIKDHPLLKVRIVDNPKRIIPAALNRALAESTAEVIIRVDGHSRPDPDYVARSVQDLNLELGDNVGGVWIIQPYNNGVQQPTWIARGIAAAAAHPLGVGDAQYRFASKAGEVDTVPFGAFRRQLIGKIGSFNEDLLTNEDYEFNHRIRLSGGKVWLDPAIRSTYFARPDISSLINQYWRYGYWKAKMLSRFPSSVRWRQILPPLFVTILILLGILSIFDYRILILFLLLIGLYGLALSVVSLSIAFQRKDFFLLFSIPLAFASMHISWGSAFLYSSIMHWIKKQ